MGLLTIIKKVKRKEREMRLLLVGLDNAGKTTAVRALCGEEVATVSPTLGFAIRSLDMGGYRLNVWDVGGQRSLRPYWRNYFERTDALVWVVDSADARRLADTARELRTLLAEERLAGASLLVLANKQDVAGALSPERVQQELGLDGLKGRHWRCAGCSAVAGEGLRDAFLWLVADVAGRIYTLD